MQMIKHFESSLKLLGLKLKNSSTRLYWITMKNRKISPKVEIY